MIPIICVVGKSGAGKTTLLEKLIPVLVRRGRAIAAVKHDTHGFDIDHEGKDSWRHKQAGADMTVISSPAKLALVTDTDHDHTLSEIRDRFVTGVELILSEGYKREIHPKIEVFRRGHYDDLLCVEDDNLVAIAGNPPNPPDRVPVFDLNDVGPLCDFIEERFLSPQ